MNKLSPFKKLAITVGNLPTAYIESMSYYECLTYLVNYITKNIEPNVIQNTEAIKELQEYVTNYFDDLDVQQEINNKLDEMADDGTLAQIINVEMIGSLSNLTTTDKSSIVNAINEVDNNTNQLNFTTFNDYEVEPEIGSASVDYGTSTGLNVASNTAGTIAKIYGTLTFTNISHDGNTTYTTGVTQLRPSANINIDPIGIRTWTDQNGLHSGSVGIQLLTTGEIKFTFYSDETVTSQTIVFIPCLLFLSDFGD